MMYGGRNVGMAGEMKVWREKCRYGGRNVGRQGRDGQTNTHTYGDADEFTID